MLGQGDCAKFYDAAYQLGRGDRAGVTVVTQLLTSKGTVRRSLDQTRSVLVDHCALTIFSTLPLSLVSP